MAENTVRETLTEKERSRLERIDRLDANKRRKKVIFAAVTAVLILFFVAGTVFGGMYILSYEGTQPLPQEEVSYPVLLTEPTAVHEHLLQLITQSKDYKSTKADVSVSVSVPEDSILLTGDKAQSSLAYLLYVRPSAEELLRACYEEQCVTGSYGTDFSDLLSFADFETREASVEAVVHAENENDLRYVFTFAGCDYEDREQTCAYSVFELAAAADTVQRMQEAFAEVAVVGDAALSYADFEMTAQIDRLADRLQTVNRKRICRVTLPLTFIGAWEEFGEMTLAFDVEIVKTLRFTRVGFAFREDVYYIEKGASDEFKTSIVTDESPADVVIEWQSSDESVLSVDGNFYKGEKVSASPVTVTGTYTCNGVSYSDTCLFYVRVPVEGCRVSEKEMTLAVGQSDTLTANISPKDATLQTVYWFTSDASVATVGEDGTVTATGVGQTEIYCITLDGNYRSVCMLTVTE